MGSLAGPLAMPLGGDISPTRLICNPSRGGATPASIIDPVGVRALDRLRASFRSSSSFVDLSSLQTCIGFAKMHANGYDGLFEDQLRRTKLGSVLSPSFYTTSPTFSVLPSDGLRITKTDAGPQASVYFTSIDRGQSVSRNALIAVVLRSDVNPSYGVDSDPLGPLIGIEHGPRNTAVYVMLVDTGSFQAFRICGPSVNGVRAPDVFIPFDYNNDVVQYTLVWNDSRGRVELWLDDTAGLGGIGSVKLYGMVPISSFQSFGTNGTVPVGGANDITGVYGVEGKLLNSATFRRVAIASDVSFPLIDGARVGGWKTLLDSDFAMGFSGAVDPTRLTRGGAWFFDGANDPEGRLVPNTAGGFCSLQKKTPSSSFSIFRDEPGFFRNLTDGIMVEFKCGVTTSGGVGFETGAAISVWDGTSLFQFDFLFDGTVHNLGLLKAGGDPGNPNDHLLGLSPIDYALRTLRIVIDPGRATIEVFDVELSLITPLASWPLNRAILPTTAYAGISIGLPVDSTAAVGSFDIYSLRYSYVYNSWESRDLIDPTAATPAWTNSPALGSTSIDVDGLHILCEGGETELYHRDAFLNVDRGGAIEAHLSISEWHPSTRTGIFMILDDGIKAYMLSFIETDTGRYVCVPLAADSGQFQEYAGKTGLGRKLSVEVDWTQPHTYRLERRPRDGVCVFVDNTLVLSIPDSDGHSFPVTRFSQAEVAFGNFTDEGSTSVWRFVRTLFGSGFEFSTAPDQPQHVLSSRLSNVHTTVLMTAGD